MAPAYLVDPSVRPTKVDRTSDVTGLVDTGKLVGLLDQDDAVRVMESIQRLSDRKLARVDTGITRDAVIKDMVRCNYVKAADLTDRYGDPSALNPELDPDIVGPAGIFTQQEFHNDAEFRKTAAVMKLVINGYAGAGTITMGGYDYHGQGRATGELRDLRAGRCMGACLEYAARRGVPLMLYVFSDGSLSADGVVDNSADGRGKFDWSSDNQQTAASFFLVYNPQGTRRALHGRQPAARAAPADRLVPERRARSRPPRTPAANNVNLLVEAVVLNYMALHGEQGQFGARFPGHGLGSAALQDSLIAFNSDRRTARLCDVRRDRRRALNKHIPSRAGRRYVTWVRHGRPQSSPPSGSASRPGSGARRTDPRRGRSRCADRARFRAPFTPPAATTACRSTAARSSRSCSGRAGAATAGASSSASSACAGPTRAVGLVVYGINLDKEHGAGRRDRERHRHRLSGAARHRQGRQPRTTARTTCR